MKFSYNWLKKIVGFKDTPEELAEFLTLRAFEVESVEKLNRAEHKEDWALDVKILPNRVADASGHWGLAREIAALKGIKFSNPKINIKENKKDKVNSWLKVKVENKKLCPRYSARIITGVKVGESPEETREKLEACGLQSINNLVDAANLVMLETGQPLHVFDYEKLAGAAPKTIFVRSSRAGEKFVSLENKSYEFPENTLLIADEKEALAVAGIKGGKSSGVDENTKMIVLEAATFDPTAVRLASQKLNLKTDASFRFEHAPSPYLVGIALDRLAELIKETAGGEIAAGKAENFPNPQKPQNIFFRPSRANNLLGLDKPDFFYQKIFLNLGWKTIKRKDGFLIETPVLRQDLMLEEDLIEEAGRAIGYENIKEKPAVSFMSLAAKNENFFWAEKTRDILSGFGFTEAFVYEFTGDKELKNFRLAETDAWELENPVNPDNKYLVPKVLIKYVAAAAPNLKNFTETRMFGLGKTFLREEKKGKERADLVLVLARKNTSGEEGFYQMKGFLDRLFSSLGLSDVWYDDAVRPESKPELFHPHRRAEIKSGDEKIGDFGEIHPEILRNIKAGARITAVEINFEKLWKNAREESEYKPIGKFPAIIRDLAVMVPEDTRVEDVAGALENAGGKLLVDTDLFDFFQDENMTENNQKSMAFHLTFQSADRTLADSEVNSVITDIIKELEGKNWEVKK